MMGVPSLYTLAKRASIKNIPFITDVGDIPYDHLRPILARIPNPEQLRDLEKTSPHLLASTHELWVNFIKRDVENGEQKLASLDRPASYKIWRKLCRADKEVMDKDAALLAASMQSLKDAQAQRTSKVVDQRTLPKLPRMNGMRPEKGRAGAGTRYSSTGDPSLLTFGSGSKTKVTTGAGVVSKARREARELSLFSAKKSVLATPTHKLNDKASWVGSAPKGLLDHHKTMGQPEIRKTTIMVPRRGTSQSQTGSASRAVAGASPRSLQPAGGYKVPRQGASSPSNEPLARPAARTRAPATDPFMPAKRRRLV